MAWFLALLLLWPPPAAQAPSSWPIETLSVQGNSRYSTERILAVAGLKVGQTAGKAELDAARNRLIEAGAFASVGYSYRPSLSRTGIAVTLEVVEAEQVYPFRFERLDASPADLVACLLASDPLFGGGQIPATKPILDRYAKALQAFLSTPQNKVEVVGRLMADRPGELVVVFGPAAPPPSVAEVRFTGNQVIPTTLLQNTIAEVAIGLVYSEDKFREILDSSIRRLYDARGRLRVAFPKIQVEKAQSVDGVAVTVQIVEGEVYSLGEVRLAGEGLPEKDLLKAGDFKSGDIANFDRIESGVGRIRGQLRRMGFMRTEAKVERTLDDQQKKVSLVIHVETGPRFLFGKLVIEGLDLNAEAEVRRLWGLKPGAPFDADYPDYFLGRLRQDGVFDKLGKTKSEIKLNEQSRTADVTLVFFPASPKKSLGAAVSGAHVIVGRCAAAELSPRAV